MRLSKSGLGIELSRLEVFSKPDPNLEQYPTDPEIAADMLWNAFLLKDLLDVVDLGCGTGILSIGAAFLGAKVIGIDKDKEALDVMKKNIKSTGLTTIEILKKDILKTKNLKEKLNTYDLIDLKNVTVIMNPPFGANRKSSKNADKKFLEKAFEIANTIYSMHKTSTKDYIIRFANRNGFEVTHRWDYSFLLKNSMDFHSKNKQRIKVSSFRFKCK